MKRKSIHRSVGAVVEPLEIRQLLDAVVDIRLGDGTHAATVTSIGQQVNFQVWVTVTGTDGDNTNEGLQTVVGSVLSSDISGGAALGNMTTTLTAPFNGSGSQNGTPTDLDGDGDLDVGSNNPAVPDGFLFARDGVLTTDGTPVTQGEAFEIATGTFTVTSLSAGVETDIVFRPRTGESAFIYEQDGRPISSLDPNSGGSLSAGAPLVLKRAGSASISGRVFNDTNADGIFDGADTGIDGFRVYLDANANGVLDAGEVSKPVSATGTYHFTGIESGTYRVREVYRDGWRQSYPALGYYQVTLGYGDVGKTQSFANTDKVVIKGTVFMDANKNKEFDAGEAGLPNWMVYLDLNNDSILDKGDDWALTDANGNYRFSNLPGGKYSIRVANSSNYRLTTPAGGVHTKTLAGGGSTSNQNFGEKRLA